MALAQGLGWTEYRVTGFGLHYHFSWSVAVIIGALLSISAGKIMPKKFILAISSFLILAGGIIFIISPQNTNALIAGRYLNGIAVGLATTPYLMLISDISRSRGRGACVGIEQLSFTLGIAIQIAITSQWDVRLISGSNRLHGILDIIFAVLTALALWHFVESPVDFLRMGDEASALEILARLQRPPRVNSVTNVLLMEHNTFLCEQNELGMASSIGPMLKMIFFRSMMLAFVFSLPLSETLKYSTRAILSETTIILGAVVRILGSLLSSLVTDRIGRKLPALISSLTIGGLMISIAVICHSIDNLTRGSAMGNVAILCLLLQFFGGLLAPLTSAFVAEAFPLRTKSYCIAFCVMLEQAIHIIVLCCAAPIGNDGTLMAEGIMIVVASVFFCMTMPETKQTSQREAQKRFRNFFNWKML
ncbi:uncharacterized protein LOC142230070 [Haematobia irritans]|uniref:uncharacterized protein LOC142230070 n=1 Tax=Haematobia irritans TaxID=7368 RepID=UPI003F50A372